jgi:hypothetical protein
LEALLHLAYQLYFSRRGHLISPLPHQRRRGFDAGDKLKRPRGQIDAPRCDADACGDVLEDLQLASAGCELQVFLSFFPSFILSFILSFFYSFHSFFLFRDLWNERAQHTRNGAQSAMSELQRR